MKRRFGSCELEGQIDRVLDVEFAEGGDHSEVVAERKRVCSGRCSEDQRLCAAVVLDPLSGREAGGKRIANADGAEVVGHQGHVYCVCGVAGEVYFVSFFCWLVSEQESLAFARNRQDIYIDGKQCGAFFISG